MAKTKRAKIEAKARRKGARGVYDGFRAEVANTLAAPDADPTATVIAARRRAGAKTDDDARRPMMGEAAGQAIAHVSTGWDEVERLWSTFCALDAADSAYASRYVGIRRFPSVSGMELLPERIETRPDDRIDTRTEVEKDRDAVSTWMRWQGLLGRLPRDQHVLLMDGVRHRARLVHAGRATVAGVAFVAAMRALDVQFKRG